MGFLCREIHLEKDIVLKLNKRKRKWAELLLDRQHSPLSNDGKEYFARKPKIKLDKMLQKEVSTMTMMLTTTTMVTMIALIYTVLDMDHPMAMRKEKKPNYDQYLESQDYWKVYRQMTIMAHTGKIHQDACRTSFLYGINSLPHDRLFSIICQKGEYFLSRRRANYYWENSSTCIHVFRSSLPHDCH